MSHNTPGNGNNTWAHLAGQQRLYQQSGSQPAPQTTATPHDPFSAFVDTSSSAFDYSHLTPDQSSDEPFHTPELDDLLWQVSQTEHGDTDMSIDGGTSQDMSIDGAHPSLQPEAPITFHHNLPSPQLTNTSTPEASGHSKRSSRGNVSLASPNMSPQQVKRPLVSSHADMSYDRTLDARDPRATDQYTPSPMIQISNYHRGDSPARAEDGVRLNKKRSASNLSQSELNSQQEDDTSHLRPHQNDPEEEWDSQEPERLGVAPVSRGEEEIASIEDMEHQKQHEDTIHEVESWLERTSIDPDAAARRTAKLKTRSDLMRSRSTGMKPRPALERGFFDDRHIPGPGRLVDEQSDYAYSDHSSDNSSVENYPETIEPELPPRKPSVDFALAEQEPLPSQFFRRSPWQDPPRARTPTGNERWQPDSSNAAIQRFQQRAKNFETASRAATWGTGRWSRRLSDGEIDAILGDGKATRHLSLSKRTRERGSVFMNEMRAKAKESIMKRSNSHQKRHSHHAPDLEKVHSPDAIEERSSTDSLTHIPTHTTQSQSSHSHVRTKSPPHTTSHAVMAAATNLAAVGAGSTRLSVDQHRHESFIKKAIKRVRSRSDVNKSPKTTNSTSLAGLLTQQGGMPVPIVAHHSHENLTVVPVQQDQAVQPPPPETPVYSQQETPIKMDLTPRATNIIPNLEGFKTQIRELNPRLEPYLVERIAHDQVKRYKRLVKSKVDHTAAMAEHRCGSGSFCKAFGGEAEILTNRGSVRDVPASSGQFRVANANDSDPDDSNFDGVVSAALFPEGIPLPPAKRLPAKFECYLCFQVKTFQKPSDWTKHVHEDVQPFTCTFPQCPDPKPFKRKADWVRHENERHRHLEWWQCNIQECQHKCYRKDNFVQHLVREHKRKEPKIKGRANTNAKGKSRNVMNTFNQEERDFWNLVDSCRKDGATDARTEPCKFCGNVCASWKKLSVHVGKHMEQIAMPVLELARQRNVTKDTIISPVEPLPNRTHGYPGMDQAMVGEVNNNMNITSPYTQSGASNYQSSSAGHSPAVMHNHVQSADVMVNQHMYLDGTYPTNAMHQGAMGTLAHEMPGTFASAPEHSVYNYNAQFGNNNNNTYPGMFPQTQMQFQQDMPRSQAMGTSYMTMQSPYDAPQQYFSSPEMEQQSFIGYQEPMHGNNMVDTNHMIQGHMTTPVATQGMNNDYVYPQSYSQPHPHTHGSAGNQYYQS